MPHLLYLAYGFPPAAKSGNYRMRAVANAFAARGWDVTAVSLADESWHRENGLDRSTLQGLSPRVRRHPVPVAREDLEPDLLLWSEERALDPDAWRAKHWEDSTKGFPEKVFGFWEGAFRDAVEQVHRERPADLLLVSPMPYVMLSAARHLHRTAGVPYLVDFRDGWSLDVVSGAVAFEPDSREGRIEQDVLEHAEQVWFVNGRIKDFYAPADLDPGADCADLAVGDQHRAVLDHGSADRDDPTADDRQVSRRLRCIGASAGCSGHDRTPRSGLVCSDFRRPTLSCRSRTSGVHAHDGLSTEWGPRRPARTSASGARCASPRVGC